MRVLKLLLLIACSLIITERLNAQHPFIPKFKQADPIWQHALANPLYVNLPNGFFKENAYTCVAPKLTADLLVDNFLISVVPTNNDFFIPEGLIVQKINIRTGEVIWKDIIYDATIDSIGMVSCPKIIYRRSDGNIEFCGNRKIIKDNIQIYDYSYRAVYDFETGHRTLYYDKSNNATYPDKNGSNNGIYWRLEEDALYLKSYLYFEGGEDPKRGFSFCLVNDSQDSIQYIKTILMDPQMPVHRFTFRGYKEAIVNDSILAILLNLQAPPDSNYYGKNILYLFNYKDISNIHLIREIDITDYAIYDGRPGGVPAGALYLRVFNGDIFVNDVYYDFEERKQFNYLLKLDDHGNVLDYTDIIKTNDDSYYAQYNPFYITDTLKLFWAYKSKFSNKFISFDLVKMNDNKEMEYIASLFPVGNQSDYFNIFKTFLLDNQLILYGNYSLGIPHNENEVDANTSFIMSFDMDELKKGSTIVKTS
ncbi:MAG: hypothetical protein LC107_04070, partial [Chitinophagales bacterium]|nr:hypothetical protein [Chitinophagales bacterium]